MKKWTFIFCVLIMFAGASHAQSSKPFVITYVVYPGIEDYVALVESIYTELGFQVSLIPTPSVRGLILLNDGAVDADVVRATTVAKNYPNVILAQPSFKQLTLNLICVVGVPCNQGILSDSSVNILANDRILDLFEPGEFSARKIDNELVSNVADMLKAQRYYYALFAMDELITKNFSKDFQVVKILDLSVHHVIQKKHAELLPLIEEKLRAKLPEFKRLRQTP